MKESFKTPYWSFTPEELFQKLGSARDGLTEEESKKRKAGELQKKELPPAIKDLLLFLYQFRNPLVLLLIFGLLFSALLGELVNATIIFCILLLSGLLGFIQERKANKAAQELRSLVQVKASVRRSGKVDEIEIDRVVPGDIILLNAGDIIPADAIILESCDLYINQSVLTGESFPAEKKQGILPASAPMTERYNMVFKSTNVISGTATIIATATGNDTEIGKIETEVGKAIEETAFEKGLKKFGLMLMKVAFIIAGIILIFNISSGKPLIDSILFALALSLGLTPELLPAIVTITLSAGARQLAKRKVIVKKLSSIQNLGSINILCSDKTGTLTEGLVKVNAYLSVDGSPSELVQKYAYLNSVFESGYSNPIDDAIRSQSAIDITGYAKCDEVPFDFVRKRLSIVVSSESKHTMITKGALSHVMETCDTVQLQDSTKLPIGNYKDRINEHVQQLSREGYRVIGIACKDVTGDPVINKDDETGMTLLGIVTLNDPLKEGIVDAIGQLKNKNVTLKIITGDNLLVATAIATSIGIAADRVISGTDIDNTDDENLKRKVNDVDIFAETVPTQKERIVKALQNNGHVVGYLGDGINDAAALKAADVGISVNNAVDVAKESSDIILLEKKLDVVIDGIAEGRKTYLNTLKYIFITISANFGNMFSMAGASLLLPFLPLLPSQILLTNFLTDLPALSIASDNVDKEMVETPRKWDMKLIRNFMIVFGLESSLFDFITFGTLIWVLHANADLFRTGWFIESVITEVLILLVIRTRRTFIKSAPGKLLLLTSLAVVLVTFIIPYLPFSIRLGLVPLPAKALGAVVLIAACYSFFSELTKKILFRKMRY